MSMVERCMICNRRRVPGPVAGQVPLGDPAASLVCGWCWTWYVLTARVRVRASYHTRALCESLSVAYRRPDRASMPDVCQDDMRVCRAGVGWPATAGGAAW